MTTNHDTFRLLCQRLGAYEQEMIDLQRELVSRNAVGPEQGGPGDERHFLARSSRENPKRAQK